jgi:ribosome biogenesis GTPase
VTSSPWWSADAPAEPDARLAQLGWGSERAQQFEQFAADGLVPGRAGRIDRGVCAVLLADGTQRAVIPSRELTPAVGDWLAVEPRTPQSDPVVRRILPRRTAFVRHAAGEETLEQVVAANIDNVFIVNGLDQRLALRGLERYLALTWQSGANPVIVLTKTDLAADVEGSVREAESVALGVPVLTVSARAGTGIDQLDRFHGLGATVALLGPSGAGKSTLINRLLGERRLATGEVRDDGRGRHTTTRRELVPLPGGGVLIDTPGIRAVGMWDADEGLQQAFADVEELAAGCRFSDCAHRHEPGCAVRAAMEAGTLDPARLESYEKLQAELRFQERKLDARARAEERRKWRNINRALRNSPKGGG